MKRTENRQFECSSDMRVALPSVKAASIVCRALEVDSDLREDRSTRSFRCEDNVLVIEWKAQTAKFLRTSMLTLLEMVKVAIEAAEFAEAYPNVNVNSTVV